MDGLVGRKGVCSHQFKASSKLALTSSRGEPPSNVTRISRGLCRTCSDGTHQIINYFPGVGTANAIDRFTGGAFGMGLDQVSSLIKSESS